MAATGVSMCLYYLSYNQDAMERVSLVHSGDESGFDGDHFFKAAHSQMNVWIRRKEQLEKMKFL